MTIIEITEKIKELLAGFTGRTVAEIPNDSDLVKAGIIDSLATVHMILAIEDEYDVTIYPDVARDLLTLELIASYIFENR